MTARRRAVAGRERAREIACSGIALDQKELLSEEQLLLSAVVEIRLVARAAAIDVVQVEARRAEVHDGVGIALLLVKRRRIEGEIVVDELAEVGIGRAKIAFFRVRPVLHLAVALHFLREREEVVLLELDVRRRKHPSKAT